MKKKLYPIVIFVFLVSIWFDVTLEASKKVAVESIEVITTIPIETSLGHADTKQALDTWVEMINSSVKTIDLAQFYMATKENEPLETVIHSIIKAADRGIKVRFLVGTPINKNMAENTEAVKKRFDGHPNIIVTNFNWKDLTGGILHAKYFIVDNREVYIGSQNFDWRSLKHIHETGLRIKSRTFAMALYHIFEADWQYNRGDKDAYRKLSKLKAQLFDPRNFLVGSPEANNPPGVRSAIKTLIQLIDNARKKITIQLLSYGLTIPGSSEKFTLIDDALRRAAGRGVTVNMVVADWNKREPNLNYLKALSKVTNIHVKFATIPAAGSGFIPYARVIHSKVMCIDDNISWVGTSNWEYGYFYKSRNMEVVSHIPEIAKILERLFNELWNSKYTDRVDPEKEYLPPRIE